MEPEQEQPEAAAPPLDEAAAAAASCSNCDAFLQGHCNPSNQVLYLVCKLRTGTRKEKEEAARQLGEFAKESVRPPVCPRSLCLLG